MDEYGLSEAGSPTEASLLYQETGRSYLTLIQN